MITTGLQRPRRDGRLAALVLGGVMALGQAPFGLWFVALPALACALWLVACQTAGRAAFGDNCAPCHGSGAQGSKGFPNLNDDNWIWGGTLDDIHYTLVHGIRWEADADTRNNIMMAYGRDGLLTCGNGGCAAAFRWPEGRATHFRPPQKRHGVEIHLASNMKSET